MRNLFRNAFGGGGNRGVGRDIVRKIELAAKFLKDAKTIRRKDDKFETEIVAISRHSERIAKESSLLQYKAAAKNENNSTETDHASMPLGIFASKSASDVGIAMPTYFKDLAASLPSRLAAKKVAFTLAEVLITLGIIGVVAAITIPTLIAKYQLKEGTVALKKEISVLNQAAANTVVDFGSVPECYFWLKSPYPPMGNCLKRDERGACIQWGDDDGNPRPSDYQGRSTECSSYNKILLQNLKIIKTCNKSYYDGCTVAYKGYEDVLKEKNDKLTDDELYIQTQGRANLRAERIKELPAIVLADGSIIIQYTYPREIIIDVNGKHGPNKWGYDLFYVILYGAPDKGLFYKPSASLIEKGGLNALDALLK